jgi:hypothetical protein
VARERIEYPAYIAEPDDVKAGAHRALVTLFGFATIIDFLVESGYCEGRR